MQPWRSLGETEFKCIWGTHRPSPHEMAHPCHKLRLHEIYYFKKCLFLAIAIKEKHLITTARHAAHPNQNIVVKRKQEPQYHTASPLGWSHSQGTGVAKHSRYVPRGAPGPKNCVVAYRWNRHRYMQLTIASDFRARHAPCGAMRGDSGKKTKGSHAFQILHAHVPASWDGGSDGSIHSAEPP